MFIAFGHRKNVGKDTAARFLSSYLRIHRKNSDIRTAGFADKVKDIACQLYCWAGMKPGWHYDEPENYHEKNEILPKLNKSPRQIWIDIGSGVGRRVYEHTWIDFLQYNVKCDILIVKDLRFPNEADQIHAHGGYVYKINRDNVVHTPDEADDPLENYSNWDGVINNNNSLVEFNKQIIELGEKLRLQLT